MSAHGPVPVLPGPALLGALLVQPVPSLNDGRHEVVGSVAPPVVVHNEIMKHWYVRKDFITTKKAPNRALSWFDAP